MHAPDRFSFPSGHAASSLSVALAVATLLAAPWSGLLVALALVVGLSRCYLGDVVVGWLLALLGTVGASAFLG